ncbi:MAG: hypothetical protein IIX38_03860, partial [Alistipes sp.]|nr:hypothetical protein [Alistipes sp.]
MKHLLLILTLAILPLAAEAKIDVPESPNVQVIRSTTNKNSDSNIFGHIIDTTTKEHIPYAT